jgi:NAD(P)-dependent dehydrogenase (short-subunit alcohol dehydrogenase family)
VSEFRDRVALITGAGSGIGGHLARLLAAEGARIAALDRVPEGLAALAADLAGRPAATAVADVTDLAATRAAVARLEQQIGPADLLIAAAGIGRATAAAAFQAEEINAHIQVNLIGVVNSIDSVLAGMRQRRRGHLVVLSSLASYRGLPFMAGYCASKAGVNALLDSLRLELPALGIDVTTICPGWIRTPMTAALNLSPSEVMDLDRAGRTILAAIRQRRPFVAFPAHLARRVRLLRHLPCPLSDWLTRRELPRAKRLLPEE